MNRTTTVGDGRRLARPCSGCSASLRACTTRCERDAQRCCADCAHRTYDDQETR